MLYEIRLKSSALKELKKLPKTFSEQIAKEINALSVNPRPHGHKKLKGNEELYRIRSGNYRVIYQIQDTVLVVLIIRIGNRKDVPRELR